LWKDVLRGKYGEEVIGRVDLGEKRTLSFSSLWWRDICSIGINLDNNWLSQQVIKKLGNGDQTSFWKDIWVGLSPLCVKFPRLFSISMQKDASVASLWNSNEHTGWNLVWRRRLFVWETILVDELNVLLGSVVLSTKEDGRGWRPEQGGDFKVKYTYDLVTNLITERNLIHQDHELGFKVMWKCMAPSKVSGFVWMVLHDRVPTRENLFRRQIIEANGDRRCVFYGDSTETAPHLFIYCTFILQVRERVLTWLGLSFMLPHNILSLLSYVATTSGSKRVRQSLVTIWCAVMWTVWRHRNQIIFDNGVVDGVAILEEVKLASWKWWIGRGKSPLCLFYEWISEPVLCLNMG
jgi:hypothetical protein